MPCQKTLPITSACALDTCSTQSRVLFTAPSAYNLTVGIAYAPDACYCLVLTNNAAFTITYFHKYDPATNTLSLRYTYPGYIGGPVVYDATAKLFVIAGGLGVITFDPLTELTDTFAGPTPTFSWVYVPEKGKVYGHMGRDGLLNYYVGYIDIPLRTVIQLGTIPNIGASHPFGYNLAYSPISNSLYGFWITGTNQGLLKFNLTSNTGFPQVINTSYIMCCWDPVNEILVGFFSGSVHVDTATDTIVGGGAFLHSVRWYPSYIASTAKIVVAGYSNDPPFNTQLYKYDPQNTTLDTTPFGTDYDYPFPLQLKDGSFISSTVDLSGGNPEGIRRICIT